MTRTGTRGGTTAPRSVRALVAMVVIAGLAVTASQAVVGPLPVASAAAGDITTVAGSSAPGPSAAPSISLIPWALARFGNQLYTSDGLACVVRKVDLGTGQQTIFAGTGGCGFGGDGGAATAAVTGLVHGLAVDAAGNVFLAENAGRIRRVAAGTGTITTVAGTGTWGFSGDGGPATAAQLNRPYGLAVDVAGNLYIADSYNGRVRRVAAATGIITTFAGGGASLVDGVPATTASLDGPWDVEMTPSGGVAIAESGGNIVRSVAVPSGTITTLIGKNRVQGYSGDNGPAINAAINAPAGLSYDSGGNLLVTDYASASSVVRRVDATTGVITRVAGKIGQGFSGDNGPATSASMDGPAGVVAGAAAGTFYVADAFNKRVRAVVGGTITTIAGDGSSGGSGIGGPFTQNQLTGPGNAVADAGGNLYVSDTGNARVVKVAAGTGIVSVFAGGGQADPGNGGAATGARLAPGSIAIDGAGNVFIAEPSKQRIRRVDGVTKAITTYAGTGTTGATGDGGPAAAATFNQPTGLSFDTNGNLFVADAGNLVVRAIAATGTHTVTRVAGGGGGGPGAGDNGPALAAGFAFPNDTAVDGAGNVYITDWNNSASWVRRVDATTHVITTITGRGVNTDGDGLAATDAKMTQAVGVLTDSTGNVYVADQDVDHARIRRIDTSGIINTVAGGGATSFGDGGSARDAHLVGVGPMNWDPNGNMLFADGNQRIRRVAAPFKVGGGGFHPVVPTRVLDSRTTTGGWNGRLAAGAPRSLAVTGVATVPATATAVIMNVTATGASNASFLTAWPAGVAQPALGSNVNFAANETIPNLVTVKVGAGGRVLFANAVGTVDVVADLVGYFDDGSSGGDLFRSVAPARILDSRTTNGGWNARLAAGEAQARPLTVRGQGGVSGTATAVVMNVTATGGSAPSFLQVWPSDAPRPNSSNLNFAAGQTIPNLVTVKLGADGKVEVLNAVGTVDVVADVVGYFDPSPGGLRFHALPAPRRALDSRSGLGVPAKWSDGMSRAFDVAGPNGFRGAGAMIMNTTVTNATQGSFVSVYPQGGRSTSSNINFGPGQTIANLVMTKLPPNGYVELYNSLGSVDIIGDVTGYYGPG